MKGGLSKKSSFHRQIWDDRAMDESHHPSGVHSLQFPDMLGIAS